MENLKITRDFCGNKVSLTLTFDEMKEAYLRYQRQVDIEDVEVIYEGMFSYEQLNIIAKIKRDLMEDDNYGWNEAVHQAVKDAGLYHIVEAHERREQTEDEPDPIDARYMIFTGEDNTKVIFDDFDRAEEAYWSTMCVDCKKKYGALMIGKFDNCCAIQQICGVKGCGNEADFYVDFHEDEVEFEY